MGPSNCHSPLNHLKSHRASVPLFEDGRRASAAIAIPDPALQWEVREKINAAFRELPARLQAAARLAFVEEIPYEEIADAVESSGTA